MNRYCPIHPIFVLYVEEVKKFGCKNPDLQSINTAQSANAVTLILLKEKQVSANLRYSNLWSKSYMKRDL